MGLDRLGILFIIIILPIALVLNTYVNTQVDTLKLQIEYDTKLNNATADAVRTYQNNSLNEDASNLGDVRTSHINGAINVFFTSLASNLNLSGYTREFIQEYVPAVVFTMYDGYYIYSKYTNTLEKKDFATEDDLLTINRNNGYTPGDSGYLNPSTYYNGQQLYGLKPFIHYSCRYRQGNDNDVVVSYTLDNYITVQGILDGNPVDKSGYLIDIGKFDGITIGSDGTASIDNGKSFKYRGVEITKESLLTDNLVLDTEDGSNPETKAYPYHKVNGIKYYYDDKTGYWFKVLNGKKGNTDYTFDENEDYSAFNYYKEAFEFSNWVNESRLSNLRSNLAVTDYDVIDENNQEATEQGFTKNSDKIFNLEGIEDPVSVFNQHRREVIKYTIEKNLSIAIANYNTYGNKTLDFRMPKFSEAEWDRIQNNMTVISYLQGLPIGTKIYNGVAVVANNENKEVVAEDSIYIGDGGNTTAPEETGKYYYSVLTDPESFKNENSLVGIYNVDLRRREVEYNKQTYYYYPKLYFEKDATSANLDASPYNGNIYKYIDEKLIGTHPDSSSKNYKIAQAYYTALGRERKSRYNQRNNYENMIRRLSDTQLEKVQYNSRFESGVYDGKIKTKEETQKIIDIALNNNNIEENRDNRVIVRAGSGPSKMEYYENYNTSGNEITDDYVNALYKNLSGNYVVATETSNGYVGPLTLEEEKNYKIKYYYLHGKVKVIFIK